ATAVRSCAVWRSLLVWFGLAIPKKPNFIEMIAV
ncbi:MAG: hypothetical protein ACI8QN_001390, partial [Porticoccaceae bacterium]